MILSDIINELNKRKKDGIAANGIFSIIRNNSHLLSEITEKTSYLDSDCEIGRRLWHLTENATEIPKCPRCVNNRLFYRYSNGYHPTCGDKECRSKMKVESFKKTIDEKYGNNYFGEGSSAREKYKNTMLNKYGVDHNFKCEDTKIAIKATMREKYGTEHALRNSEILEKRNSTCIDRHGSLNFIHGEKASNTNKAKYGNINAMKNKDIAEKVAISSSTTKRNELGEKLDEFNIKLLVYNSIRSKLLCAVCDKEFTNHPVSINYKLRNSINPCPSCNPPNMAGSKMEDELHEFISSIYDGDIKRNNREIFKGTSKFSESDIFLPEPKIAFEFNGLYWHSEVYKTKEYHQEKSKYLLSKGIKLYNIWEDDWIYKKDLIKSMISATLNISTKRTYARKCTVLNVAQSDYRKFCTENHIKGYSTASIILGLYSENELLSIMSFSKTRKLIESSKTKFEYEVIRSCTKKGNIVIGGVSKIISYFRKNIGNSLVTYCDISFSPDWTTTSYNKSGFSLVKITDPGYYWCIDGKRSNRLNWTKKKLVEKGYSQDDTVDNIMHGMGYYKIWDCGNYKFSIT